MAVFQNTNSNITTTVANGTGSLSLVGNLWTSANAYISGDLTVDGNVTYINITSLNVQDPIISLGRGPNDTPLTANDGKDRGENMWYYTTAEHSAFIGFRNATGCLIAATNVVIANEIVTVNDWGTFRMGNVIADELTGNLANIVGNINAGNFRTAGLITATGNITGGNIDTAGLITAAGNITTGANVNVAGLITAGGNITSNANVNVAGLITAGGNITSNANIRVAGLITAGGNITSNANVNVAGLITAAGNINTAANVNVAGLISATGNIIGGNLITSGSANVGSITISGNLDSGNLFTSGIISATGNITTAANVNVSGLITASGNITTVANVNVAGIITAGGNIITAANVNIAGLITAGGNIITAANVNVAGLITAGGNITSNADVNVTGLITAGGNITSNASVNVAGLITAGGNITSNANVNVAGLITAGGNVTGGNLFTSGIVSATSNITGGNILTSGIVSAIGNVYAGNVNTVEVRNSAGALTISTGSGNINLTSTANVVVNNTTINGLANPQQNQDAATKYYVDNAVSTQISYHPAVLAATIADLATTTGGTVTYAQPNGAGNGVGATITTTGSFNLIDTANVQTVGTRILVKDEGNAVINGVYTWSNATVITRSTDADTYGTAPNTLSLNDYFFVQNGNVNAGASYVVNSPTGTITFGTSNITFSEFSKAQVYSTNVSAGLSLTGTVFSAKVDNITTAFDGTGNIVVKTGADLTTPNIGAATGTSLSVTGNTTGGNLITAGLVSAAGTVTGSSLLGSVVSASANITGGNILTGGLISATGNITGGNVSATNYTGTNVSITGNITGNVNGFAVGYLNIPQVSLSANTTTAASDTGKHYYSTSAANLSLTIANNSSVSWAVGTTITVINQGTGTITIGQGSGVSMYFAGNSTAANRSLTTFGMATIINVASNTWFINGSGVY